MVKRISAFQSEDGSIFDTAEACEAYETRNKRLQSIQAFLEDRDLGDTNLAARDTENDDKWVLSSLADFLFDNADALTEALTVVQRPRRGRKPRSEAII